MRVLEGFDSLPRFRQPVVTIGTFDGVHRGHRVLLEALTGRAKARKSESVVITFDPHPRVVFGKQVELLTPLPERIRLLDELGVDNLIVAPFTKEFARLTAREFVKQYLVEKTGLAELIVGFDHRLGSDKNGDLEALGREFGFSVERIAQHGSISSSRIRELLRLGRKSEAEELLGR